MNIPIILATGREGRKSKRVADFTLRKADFETEIIDVRDWAKPVTKRYPEDQKELKKKIEEADGFIIVSPEYNSGYPGELKILLDTFLDEYKGKPVGIIGVSAGSFGGVRMIEKLRPVLVNLGMKPIRSFVTFKNIGTVFNEKGELLQKEYEDYLTEFINKLTQEIKS